MDAGQDERGREVRTRLLALGALAATVCAAPAQAADDRTGRLLVTLKAGGAARAAAPGDVARRAGARPAGPAVAPLRLLGVRPRAGAAPAAVARALRDDPRVADVAWERRASLRAEPADPAWSRNDPLTGTTLQWWARRQGFPAAWDQTRGTGARVAVIDTGIDGDHPDLAGKILATLDADDEAPGPPTQDPVGHGTHVASLACANPDNGIGLAGAGLDCGLLIARSDLTDGSVARSIVWAADQGAHAIVMAFGTAPGAGAPRPIIDAIDYAIARGAVLVAAAADDPVDDQGYPASALQPTGSGPDLAVGRGLSVTAANAGDRRAAFAGRGSQISLAAYGTFDERGRPAGLFGAFPEAETVFERPSVVPPSLGCGCRETFDGDRRYGRLQGTSMAAPVVGAAAALVRVLNPDIPAPDVVRLVKETARRPAGAWSDDLGWGILDAGQLTAAVAGIDRRPPSSRVRRLPARTRRRSVLVRWGGSDAAGAAVRAAGVVRYELWRSVDGGRPRRIATTAARSLRVRLRPGRRYAFYTIAIDAEGNREAAPARPDARIAALRARRR